MNLMASTMLKRMVFMFTKEITGPMGPQAQALEMKTSPTVLRMEPKIPRIKNLIFMPFCKTSAKRKKERKNPTNPKAPKVNFEGSKPF